MKATVFVNTSKIFGGIEKNYLVRARYLQQSNPHVHVIVGSEEIRQKAENQGIKHVILMKCGNDYDIVFFFRLWKLLKKIKPDVVFLNTKRDFFRGGLPAKCCGVNKIVGYWGSNYSFKNEFKKNLVFGKILDKLIINSKELAEFFKKRNFPLAPERIAVIYNGIELTKPENFIPFGIREKYSISENTLLLGSSGRLDVAKNFEIGIALIKKLNQKGVDAVLAIAGEGPHRNALESFVEKHDITESILFLGNVETLHKSSFYGELDAFLFFAGKNEGLPNVLLEALYQDTLVISSNTTSINEILPNCELGYIVNDEEDFEKTILQCLANNDFKKTEKRKQFVVENFSLDHTIKKTEELFYQ